MTAGAAPRRSVVGAWHGTRVGTPNGELRTESGVQPAARAQPETAAEGPLLSALVETETGRVLDGPPPAESAPLREFCAALPVLFAESNVAPALVFSRLGGSAPVALRDLLLVSHTRVHVVQRVPSQPDLAVACVADRSESVGWIVAQARARLERY
jgi:hypothetical protein